MLNYKDKIIFRYPGKSKDSLPIVYTTLENANVAVDENYIKSKLLVVFEQTIITIKEIIVTIEALDAKSGNHYNIELSVVSPDIDFNAKETGSEFEALVHTIIDKTIAYIHKEKSRKLSK